MQCFPTCLALSVLFAALATAGTARAQCPGIDTFEDNDDCASAVVITPGVHTNLTVNGVFNAGGEDPDFYEIAVPDGQALLVECVHSVAGGDIDTYLYSATNPNCGDHQSDLAMSGTSTDDERFSWVNNTGATQTYIIEVVAWHVDLDFDCNEYSLNVTLFPDPCASPAEDGFEENDFCLAAAPLAVGLHTGLYAWDTDEDYYRITVPSAEILTVDVSYHAGYNADVDLELFADTACANSADTDPGFGGEGRVTWTNSTGAPAQVVLYAVADPADGICNTYDLNVSTTPDRCQGPGLDDGLEDNDSCGSASALAAGVYNDLFTSGADQDYYLVSVPAGFAVTADVGYLHGGNRADVDLELFDDLACTNTVDFSSSTGGSGTVEWSNDTGTSATVVLRVLPDPSTGSCNDYDLSVTTTRASCLDPLADQVLEDNDDCLNPIRMFDGTTTGLFVTKLDEDFYEVPVAAGMTLDAQILFSTATADLDLYLYVDQGNCGTLSGWIDAGLTGSDDEDVTWTNNTGSTVTYYLQVAVWNSPATGDCNTYDLVISGSAASASTPFCVGDGSGGSCPCGNESALGAGEGCESSTGSGARLRTIGSNRVATDDLVFHLSQGRASQPSLLIQGSSAMSVAFKDGLLCTGNPTERLEAVLLNGAGESWTTVSIVTEGNVSPGDTRYYQQWFRDPGGVSPCGTGSNLSSGLVVTWM